MTPYDVLRMKNKLGMTSGEFIEKFTHVLKAPRSGFPVIILKMREGDLVCPFIKDYGCEVYQVRPWSCRMAPVEVRGVGVYGIAFEKKRCHGLLETKEWTVEEWMANQGLAEYDEPEALFSQIPQKIKLTGGVLDKIIMELIFVGCYDIDRFKSILKANPPLQTDQPSDKWAALLEDDLELMKFAFDWLPNQLSPERIQGWGKAMEVL